jgi:methyl-accepting chemotaxis protein
MDQAHFPGLSEHRREHQAFGQRFEALRRAVEAGEEGAVKALFTFSAEWVRGHVLNFDKAFAAFQRQGRAA